MNCCKVDITVFDQIGGTQELQTKLVCS